MARYRTLLILALVTATQTAQAFPPVIDTPGRLQASRAKIRNPIGGALGTIDGDEVIGD